MNHLALRLSVKTRQQAKSPMHLRSSPGVPRHAAFLPCVYRHLARILKLSITLLCREVRTASSFLRPSRSSSGQLERESAYFTEAASRAIFIRVILCRHFPVQGRHLFGGKAPRLFLIIFISVYHNGYFLTIRLLMILYQRWHLCATPTIVPCQDLSRGCPEGEQVRQPQRAPASCPASRLPES